MREIREIIIHCSDTAEGQNYHARDIDKWHRAQGFRKIGYHYVIDIDGLIEKGRDLEEIGAHCKGHNEHSIGICYIGGRGKDGQYKDTRTENQKTSMKLLWQYLHMLYPNALIFGHNDLNPHKACPCFKVPDFGF